MKKIAVVTLLAVSSFAMAASLNCPWFADNALPNSGVDQTQAGLLLAVIALHNNLATPMECRIDYFAADGTFLYGTDANEITTRNYVWKDDYNTFIIDPNATIQFRPVADDPSGPTTPLGQESATGVLVPNRPRYTSATNFEKKKNGACLVQWTGTATDVQGRYVEYSLNKEGMFLLPPGA